MNTHEIVFVLILYFIEAIKMSKGGFAIERGLSKERRIKLACNAFARKL